MEVNPLNLWEYLPTLLKVQGAMRLRGYLRDGEPPHFSQHFQQSFQKCRQICNEDGYNACVLLRIYFQKDTLYFLVCKERSAYPNEVLSPNINKWNWCSTLVYWERINGQKVQRDIARPHAIQQYNLYLGAVDLFDKYRLYIQVDLRSSKFWHPLFWLIMESALLNAWLLYKVIMEAADLPVKYNFFTLRKSVALALVADWESKGCRNVSPAAQSPSKVLTTTKQVKLYAKHATCGTGFVPDEHWTFFTKIPVLEGSNLTWRQLLCRHCITSRSIFWCPKCAAALSKDLLCGLAHQKSLIKLMWIANTQDHLLVDGLFDRATNY